MGDITREEFEQGRQRRFGSANPERMRVPFWEAMVRAGKPLSDAEWAARRQQAGSECETPYQRTSPSQLRQWFGTGWPKGDEPIWTFGRMGYTETRLADGRVVFVGGEYEDFYDPDFCIYNDVVVFHPDGAFDLYGYPRQLFPPTDFHTATLVGDRIILIGGLRYVQERVPGLCTVFSLDTCTFRIEPIETTGDSPGWLYKHRAELVEQRIRIRGGTRFVEADGSKQYQKNLDVYQLDLSAWRWDRVEHLSGWRTFSILRKDVLDFCRGNGNSAGFDPAWLTGFDTVSVVKHADNSTRRVVVDDVAVELRREPSSCRIQIEGVLPQQRLAAFLSELVRQVEKEVGVACEVEEV